MAIETSHWTAKVTLARVSGISADYVTNTFHFSGDPGMPNGSVSGLAARVIQFYNTPPTGQTKAVAGTLSTCLSRVANAHTVSIKYHGDFSAPVVTAWTLGAAVTPFNASTSMPAELCVCTSFKNDSLTGAPIGRRRGRVYIGPLGSSSLTGANSEVRLTDEIPPIYNAAIKDLKNSVLQTSSSGFIFVVRSGVGGSMYPVESGWTDVAFDVQRRRGIRAQGKVSWT